MKKAKTAAAAPGKKRAIARPAPPAGDDDEVLTPEDRARLGVDLVLDEVDDVNDSLQRALSELGDEAGQARVVVMRRPKDARSKPAYVNEWYASEFSLAQLAAGFGGGDYLYRVVGPDGKFLTRGAVSIEEPRNPAAARGLAAPPAVASAEPAPSAAAEIANAILTALKPVLDRPQRSTQEVLAEMKLMREVLFPDAGATKQESKSAVDSIREALELQKLLRSISPARESGGGAGGGDVLVRLIEQFGPIFSAKLQQMADGAAGAAPIAPAAGDETPPAAARIAAPVADPAAADAAAPAGGTVQPIGVVDMNVAFKIALADLAQQARADKDPVLYANLVYDRVTDDKALADLCTRADWWEFLCNINNDIRPYNAWFTQLHDELVKLAKDQGLLQAPAAS